MRRTLRKRAANPEAAPASPPAVVVNLAEWKANRGLQCEDKGEGAFALDYGDFVITVRYFRLLEPLAEYGLEPGDEVGAYFGSDHLPDDFVAVETPRGWRLGRLSPEGVRAGARFVRRADVLRLGRVTIVKRDGRPMFKAPKMEGWV